jgi:hypothetical protein
MTTVFIEAKFTGGYRVSFSRYDQTLVELIKAKTPYRYRTYDAKTKVWHLERFSDVSRFCDTAANLGHSVINVEPGNPDNEYQPPPTPSAPTAALPTLDEVFDHLLRISGPNRADAVHRQLTKVFHPDTPTGSTQLMQSLNHARDRHNRHASQHGGRR